MRLSYLYIILWNKWKSQTDKTSSLYWNDPTGTFAERQVSWLQHNFRTSWLSASAHNNGSNTKGLTGSHITIYMRLSHRSHVRASRGALEENNSKSMVCADDKVPLSRVRDQAPVPLRLLSDVMTLHLHDVNVNKVSTLLKLRPTNTGDIVLIFSLGNRCIQTFHWTRLFSPTLLL